VPARSGLASPSAISGDRGRCASAAACQGTGSSGGGPARPAVTSPRGLHPTAWTSRPAGAGYSRPPGVAAAPELVDDLHDVTDRPLRAHRHEQVTPGAVRHVVPHPPQDGVQNAVPLSCSRPMAFGSRGPGQPKMLTIAQGRTKRNGQVQPTASQHPLSRSTPAPAHGTTAPIAARAVIDCPCSRGRRVAHFPVPCFLRTTLYGAT
jgi:hypothetical protein